MKKILLISLLIGITSVALCNADVVIVSSDGQAKYENIAENTVTTTVYNTKFRKGIKMPNEDKKQEFDKLLKTYNYDSYDITQIMQGISYDTMPNEFTPSFYKTLEKGYLKYNPSWTESVQKNEYDWTSHFHFLINDLFKDEQANLLYIKIIEQLKSEYNMSDNTIKHNIMNNNPIFSSKKDTNASLKTMSEILDFMKGEGYKEIDFTHMYDIYKIYDATINDSSVSNKKQAFNNSLKQYIKRVNNFSQQQKIKENVSAPGLIFNTIFKDAFKR